MSLCLLISLTNHSRHHTYLINGRLHSFDQLLKSKTPRHQDLLSFGPPVISRLVERYVVQKFIYPAFSTPPMDNLLKTSLLSDPQIPPQLPLLPSSPSLLASMNFSKLTHNVIFISLDFSKVFDTIRYSAVYKTSQNEHPDSIYTWIISFLRAPLRHWFGGCHSGLAYINHGQRLRGNWGTVPPKFEVRGRPMYPSSQYFEK